MNERDFLKDKKRIVIKIGSSSLFHPETKKHDLLKIEKLVRIISDLRNQGRDVVLVSSGAIATGRSELGLDEGDMTLPEKQACAAVGQALLITIYQRLFFEYGKVAAQVLLTRYTIGSERTRVNAENTFTELFKLGAVPVVNENDTVTTREIKFGDNDVLSAMVAVLADADLLINMSDIDGLYDDDPHTNKNADLISYVEDLDEQILKMAKGSSSRYGSGGMATKLEAADIAMHSGIDMVITNADDVGNIIRVMSGENIGTLFKASGEKTFEFTQKE